MANKTTFDRAAFSEFLKSGWCLGGGPNTPDKFLVGWGPSTFSSSEPQAVGGFYAPDFYFESRAAWRTTPHWACVDRGSFAHLVLANLSNEVNADLNSEAQGFQWVEPSFEGFSAQVAEIREGFTRRGLEKAVPIVHAHAREMPNTTHLLRILKRFTELPGSLIPYGFWSFEPGREEGFLGATPEVLFSNRQAKGSSRGRLVTMALAGTRAKREPRDAEILLADPKERHEHQIVIDDIARVLSSFGKVEIGPTHVAELPTLFHLKTAIEVELRSEVTFDQMAKALHPTPALGVSPRALGFGEIRRWDDVAKRARYGAPIGVIAENDDGTRVADCLVAIRGIQWQDGVTRLGSGCGFVPESDIDREWSELQLKRESVKRILGV